MRKYESFGLLLLADRPFQKKKEKKKKKTGPFVSLIIIIIKLAPNIDWEKEEGKDLTHPPSSDIQNDMSFSPT